MARTEYLSLKLSKEEREKYQVLADDQGVSLGEWIRGVLQSSGKIPVYVSFRQVRDNSSISKIVYYPCMPVPGCYIEYEDGWGMVRINPHNEDGMHLEVTISEVSISGYGPQFSEKEIKSLLELGWVQLF